MLKMTDPREETVLKGGYSANSWDLGQCIMKCLDSLRQVEWTVKYW